MAHDWILDVLTDLRDFASENHLSATEEKIDQALETVSRELGARNGIAQGMAHIGDVGEFSRSIAPGRNA
jgi:hypothetical protein